LNHLHWIREPEKRGVLVNVGGGDDSGPDEGEGVQGLFVNGKLGKGWGTLGEGGGKRTGPATSEGAPLARKGGKGGDLCGGEGERRGRRLLRYSKMKRGKDRGSHTFEKMTQQRPWPRLRHQTLEERKKKKPGLATLPRGVKGGGDRLRHQRGGSTILQPRYFSNRMGGKKKLCRISLPEKKKSGTNGQSCGGEKKSERHRLLRRGRRLRVRRRGTAPNEGEERRRYTRG